MLRGVYQYDDFIGSIKREKDRVVIRTAVAWLNDHYALSQRFGSESHPCIQFSRVIDGLIAEFKQGDDEALPILVAWIVRDERAPFGMILKIKAFRAMIGSASRISPRVWADLDQLHAKVGDRRYRPREYLYLDKLLAKREAIKSANK